MDEPQPDAPLAASFQREFFTTAMTAPTTLEEIVEGTGADDLGAGEALQLFLRMASVNHDHIVRLAEEVDRLRANR